MNEANEPDPGPKPRPQSKRGKNQNQNQNQNKRKSNGQVGKEPFDLFDRRERRIEARQDWNPTTKEMALAMCAFDRRTDPTQLRHDGEDATAQRILDTTQYLILRVRQRAGYGLQQRPFEPTPMPPPGDPSQLGEQIRKVEQVFRTALQQAFPPQVGTVFPIRRFERTFAAFVAGELNLGSNPPAAGDDLALHGLPDGANYFCLAEAVLLFLHCRIETAFWTPLLRTFVGGAQFFAAGSWDRSARTWASYRAGHPRTPTPSQGILATVDHLYAAMDSSQLAAQFTELVSLALRDEPDLPRPSSIAKELQ